MCVYMHVHTAHKDAIYYTSYTNNIADAVRFLFELRLGLCTSLGGYGKGLIKTKSCGKGLG